MSGSAGTGFSLVILDLSLDSDDDRESGQGHTRSWIVILDLKCCANTSPTAATYPSTPPKTANASPRSSTTAPANDFRTRNEVMTSLIEEDLNRGVATIS